MIPRIKTGTSFKGAGLYYLHDKRREGEAERLTSSRVAWTFAINTLEDDPRAVLAEMRQTVLDQSLLKQLSGNRGDGRPTEKTVMTVSLAWSPKETLTREEMIEAGRSFLKYMEWDSHQALFVSHRDTKHPHVHLIVNRIHPETGMTLNDSWSQTRSQRWALDYERERGRIFCEAREARYGSGQGRGSRHMTYRDWLALAKIDREQLSDSACRPAREAGEWFGLKIAQKQERLAFQKESQKMRTDLRAALGETVREEFAGSWKAYAALKDQRTKESRSYDAEARRALRHYGRHGKLRGVEAPARIRERQKTYHARMREELREARKDVSDKQKERLEQLARPAFFRLAEDRDRAYRELLACHRAERGKLRKDQLEGTLRPDLLPGFEPPPENLGPLPTRAQTATYVGHAKEVAARETQSSPKSERAAADRDQSHGQNRQSPAGAAGGSGGETERDKPHPATPPKPHPILGWALERDHNGRDIDRDR